MCMCMRMCIADKTALGAPRPPIEIPPLRLRRTLGLRYTQVGRMLLGIVADAIVWFVEGRGSLM